MPDGKHRSYIFTWNNPDISIEELEQKIKASGPNQYAGQQEKGAGETIHFQFCV